MKMPSASFFGEGAGDFTPFVLTAMLSCQNY
jgi:hypothetical protein